MRWEKIAFEKVFAKHSNKMELTNLANVNPEFGEPPATNIDGLKMINIHQGGKKLIIPTGKCFSFGVKKDMKLTTGGVGRVFCAPIFQLIFEYIYFNFLKVWL